MSTRCQIQIEGSKVLIYKHCDGYPEGVLPVLLPFRDAFYEGRGYDDAYFTARCVAALIAEAEKFSAEHAERIKREQGEKWFKTYGYDRPDFLGYGVDTVIHGDIEYFYHVAKDGTVTVRKPTSKSRDAMSVGLAVSAMRVVSVHPIAK